MIVADGICGDGYHKVIMQNLSFFIVKRSSGRGHLHLGMPSTCFVLTNPDYVLRKPKFKRHSADKGACPSYTPISFLRWAWAASTGANQHKEIIRKRHVIATSYGIIRHDAASMGDACGPQSIGKWISSQRQLRSAFCVHLWLL